VREKKIRVKITFFGLDSSGAKPKVRLIFAATGEAAII
jgi:hypothetical protein